MEQSRTKALRRVQVELPAEKVDAIDALQKELGLRSKVDLLEAALALFSWAAQARKAGWKLAAWDGGHEFREVIWPLWEGVDSFHRRPQRDREEVSGAPDRDSSLPRTP